MEVRKYMRWYAMYPEASHVTTDVSQINELKRVCMEDESDDGGDRKRRRVI